jgi:hypothetical protein
LLEGKMNRLPRTLLTTLALTGILIGCGPKGATDQALTTDIQAKLYANDTTRAANVKVAVSDGVVTLSGAVPSSDLALQAVNIANGTAGVKSVNNQLAVNAQAAAANIPPVPDGAPSLPAQNAPKPPMPVGPPPPPPIDERAERRSDRKHEEMAKHEAEPPPPPVPRRVTIPAGERLSVRMIDGVDTAHNTEGQTFRASLDAPLTSNDRVIVPAGAPVTVLLASARGAGRIKGQSELELRLTSLEYKGERIPINSSVYSAEGSRRGKQTAIRTGIGAAAGAVIGAIAGGGKGAAIGSLAGGGAGAGFQLATHGQQVKVPSETQLTFRLEAPLTLPR